MSTDHHLEDNADDQVRAEIPANPRSVVPPGPAGTVLQDADPAATDLAEQLGDLAQTAVAAEAVDDALDRAAGPTPDQDFAEAVAGMANRHLQEAGLALEVVTACTGCGCTNNRACVLPHPRSIGGGMHVQTCYWTHQPGQPPRCSSCAAGEHHPHADVVQRRRP